MRRTAPLPRLFNSRLFCLVGLLPVAWLAAASTSRAGEIDFVESYALAADRAQVLKQLIPGTENYYYYNCLHLIQTEQLDKCADLREYRRDCLWDSRTWCSAIDCPDDARWVDPV
ncbi:MAG: hypothetical protein NTV55_14045 [Planctomycetota bacterium]|nr:hypothetical protein [Planctomycetota bacterium]